MGRWTCGAGALLWRVRCRLVLSGWAELLGEPAYLSAAELRARRSKGAIPVARPTRRSAGFLLFLVRLGQATQKRISGRGADGW